MIKIRFSGLTTNWITL